jgi:hypothetical protein
MYSYHQINDYCKQWQLEHFNCNRTEEKVFVTIRGEYDNIIPVEFKVTIHSNGELGIQYHIVNVPREYIREIGIKFEIEDVLDSVSWERNTYWSYYPSDHISVQQGKTALYSEIQKTYRNKPKKDWNSDSKSFYYEGTENELTNRQLTNIAKATKENIRAYKLYKRGFEVLSIRGNGNLSCRIAKTDHEILLFLNNRMDYVDLSWGNFQRNIMTRAEYSNEVIIQINTHSTNSYK